MVVLYLLSNGPKLIYKHYLALMTALSCGNVFSQAALIRLCECVIVIFEIFICHLVESLPGSLRDGYECVPSEKPKLYYHTLGIVCELSCSVGIRIGCSCQTIPFIFPKHWMFAQCFTCM